jgi:hypothetical protein
LGCTGLGLLGLLGFFAMPLLSFTTKEVPILGSFQERPAASGSGKMRLRLFHEKARKTSKIFKKYS